jgi:hypothetical protein
MPMSAKRGQQWNSWMTLLTCYIFKWPKEMKAKCLDALVAISATRRFLMTFFVMATLKPWEKGEIFVFG